MQDPTPKKPRRDSGVNMDTSGLAAWDHKPGDPKRPDWRDLETGADVRLDDVNQPSAYLRLPGEQRAALQGWIGQELVPAPLAGPRCSYALKHVFHRLPGGFYLTNGEFIPSPLERLHFSSSIRPPVVA